MAENRDGHPTGRRIAQALIELRAALVDRYGSDYSYSVTGYGKLLAASSLAGLVVPVVNERRPYGIEPGGRHYRQCPHCGNTDPAFLQSNLEPEGIHSRSRDLTILCVARVKPNEWSFDHVEPGPDDIGPDGLVACGMQWDPNQ